MSRCNPLLTLCLTCTLALMLSACRMPQAPAGRASETATRVPTPAASPTAAAMPAAQATATPVPQPPAPQTTVSADGADIGLYTYTVLEELPHDIGAYTQGLVYVPADADGNEAEDGKTDDVSGVFYESTGLRGQSTVRRVDAATGEVLAGLRVPDAYFAEGLTRWGDTLYQLTWQSNVGFIYTINADGTLTKSGEFTYTGEGWGLTDDGSRLIRSDGTNTITFHAPGTFAELGSIQVMDGDVPVTRLNELEYIDGKLYANIWMTDRIAVIDPANGNVTAWVDLSGLLAEADRTAMLDAWAQAGADPAWVTSNAVLNGIAYDAERERLFVTGKLWPKVYVVQLIPVQD